MYKRGYAWMFIPSHEKFFIDIIKSWNLSWCHYCIGNIICYAYKEWNKILTQDFLLKIVLKFFSKFFHHVIVTWWDRICIVSKVIHMKVFSSQRMCKTKKSVMDPSIFIVHIDYSQYHDYWNRYSCLLNVHILIYVAWALINWGHYFV